MALSKNTDPMPIEPTPQKSHPYPSHARVHVGAAGAGAGARRGIFRFGSLTNLLSKGRNKALSVWHKQAKETPHDRAASQTDQVVLEDDFVLVSRTRTQSGSEKDEDQTAPLVDERVQKEQSHKPENTDDLARKLRQISKYRARVYHGKIGVQEQSRYLKYKRGEATKAAAILDQEFDKNPAGSSGFDVARITQLIRNLRHAFDDLAVVENELDHLNENLTEREQELNDAEDQLYEDLTGEQLVSDNEILSDLLERLSLPEISPRLGPDPDPGPDPGPGLGAYRIASHYSGSIENEERLEADAVSLTRSEVRGVDVYGRQPWTESPAQQRHVHDSRPAVRREPSYSFDAELFSFDYGGDTEVSSSVGDTSFVGLQFGKDKPEFGDLQDELGSTSDLVLQKREDDLDSILKLEPDSSESTLSESSQPHGNKKASSFLTPTWSKLLELYGDKTPLSTLATKFSNWIPINPRSWLEFSYLIWSDYREKIVSAFEYAKISSFLRKNWSCEANIGELEDDGSVQPTVSSISDDIPGFLQQIVVHDSDEGDVEIFQLSQDQWQPHLSVQVSNITEPGYSSHPRDIDSESNPSTTGAGNFVFDLPLRRATSHTDLEICPQDTLLTNERIDD